MIVLFPHFSLCLKCPGKSTKGLNYRAAISSSVVPADLVDQGIKLMHLRHESWVPRGQEHSQHCVRKAIDSEVECAAACVLMHIRNRIVKSRASK